MRHRGACFQSRVDGRSGRVRVKASLCYTKLYLRWGEEEQQKGFCRSKVDHIIKLMSVLATSLRRQRQSWVTSATHSKRSWHMVPQWHCPHSYSSWALDVTCSFHMLQLAPSPFSLAFVSFGLRNWVLLLGDVHISLHLLSCRRCPGDLITSSSFMSRFHWVDVGSSQGVYLTTEMICVCLLLGRQHNPQVKSYELQGEGPCCQAWQPVSIPRTHTVGESDYWTLSSGLHT